MAYFRGASMKKVKIWKGTYYIDRTDRSVIFTNKLGGFIKVPEEVMLDIKKEYRGSNVLHKPFYLLAWQQHYFGGDYGLKFEVMEDPEIEEVRSRAEVFVP